MLLLDGVSVELLSRWSRVTCVPLEGCVSLKQAGAMLPLAGVSVTAWLQNVLWVLPGQL